MKEGVYRKTLVVLYPIKPEEFKSFCLCQWSSDTGMKITVGHQPKSGHFARLAVHSIHNRPTSRTINKLEVMNHY